MGPLTPSVAKPLEGRPALSPSGGERGNRRQRVCNGQFIDSFLPVFISVYPWLNLLSLSLFPRTGAKVLPESSTTSLVVARRGYTYS